MGKTPGLGAAITPTGSASVPPFTNSAHTHYQNPNMVLSSFNNNPFKLNNLVKKPVPPQQLNPNYNALIPTNLSSYTTTVLAARAAAIAAANSVNLQIMQQSSHLKGSTLTTTTTTTSANPVASSRPSSFTTTVYSNTGGMTIPQHIQAPISAADSKLNEVQLNAKKEAEQKRLEEEMRKRRERIENWRNEKKSKEEKEHQNQLNLDKKNNNGKFIRFSL